MKFVRAYTARQLNRGEGMTFHPISGERLSCLKFCTHGQWWRRSIPLPQMGWQEIQYRREYLPCINGGKKNYATGEAYPSHWKFDPFTGEHLRFGSGEQTMTIQDHVLPNLDYDCVPAQYSRGEKILIRTFYVLFAAFVVLQIVLLIDLLL